EPWSTKAFAGASRSLPCRRRRWAGRCTNAWALPPRRNTGCSFRRCERRSRWSVRDEPLAMSTSGVAARQRKFWGWGYEGEGPSEEQVQRLGGLLAARFGTTLLAPATTPRIDELQLRAPRLEPPPALAPICSTSVAARASHSYGKSFRDVVRALRRDF